MFPTPSLYDKFPTLEVTYSMTQWILQRHPDLKGYAVIDIKKEADYRYTIVFSNDIILYRLTVQQGHTGWHECNITKSVSLS